MKLRSGRRLVRRKNIYLPTEVWMDVFCFPWTTRPKMAQMVDKIGNRWFGEQLQFYLHEWGKHTLGELYFKPEGICKWHNGQYQPLDYPQTAMPENIRFCKSFEINHFDNRVFNFFHRIQSVLTADTKLAIWHTPNFEEQVNKVRTILGHLLPFIDGIRTMRTDDRMLPLVQSFPPEKFNQIKLFHVILTRYMQSGMQPIMEWLTSSNNGPKLLQLRCYENEIARQVLETIRKQFMEATKPSTFAVLFFNYWDSADFHCENATGEQLTGMQDHWTFKVFRHQANAGAGEQLRQWVDENKDKDGVHALNLNQSITLCKPSIGPGRIFALPDLDDEEEANEEEEDEDEKPSTSKKRRICE